MHKRFNSKEIAMQDLLAQELQADIAYQATVDAENLAHNARCRAAFNWWVAKAAVYLQQHTDKCVVVSHWPKDNRPLASYSVDIGTKGVSRPSDWLVYEEVAIDNLETLFSIRGVIIEKVELSHIP